MTPFMRSIKKLIKEKKKIRRKAFIKAKKQDQKTIFSLIRPKRTNLYKKRLTEKNK